MEQRPIGLRGYWPEAPVLAWMEENEQRTHFMAEIHRGRVRHRPGARRAVMEALTGKLCAGSA